MRPLAINRRQLTSCEQTFIQQLRARGFRLTPQREMVLSVLHDVAGLVTAEEVHSRVQHLSSSVDISTVYRTLDLCQEFDLVSSVDPGDGQRRYELLGLHGAHLHLVCPACGQVTGIELEVAQALVEQLQAACGFQAILDHLSIPGLCPACAVAQDG
ncbi:MAG: transcriptional repressor [Chloroflexi bacterium]|nr:transcriptional repressor [Chloroflexota bacterium]MBU1747586.1 transcriptional repressor [Chloroflexota bacterium]